MLKQLSRLEKTRNTILLLFVVLMAVSLIFFYAPGRSAVSQGNLSRSLEAVATVNGDTITIGEVAVAQENRARQFSQYGSQFTPPVKGVLDGEIAGRIVRQEAARLGLGVSDEEVANNIRQQLKAVPGFNISDKEAYRRLITENFGSVEKFEQSVRDDLAQDKLNAYLTTGATVGEAEVLDDYKRSNTTFDVVYVPVSTTALSAKIQPSEDELKNYFEQNKSKYYISTVQKKIRYIFVNQFKVGEKLDIPEADLKAEYDALAPDKKQKGVEAQQIVLKFTLDGDSEQKVMAKANEIVAEARKEGGKISADAFGNLAKGKSEDARSAQSGGKLGGLVRANPENPTDPLQQVLPLEEGAVTEPIKFGNSFYILRRGAAVPKTFEDAKQELLVSLRNRRAYVAADTLTKQIAEALKQTPDLQKVAAQFAAQANLSPAEMVRETPNFVKPGDDVPNIGVSPQFEAAIEPLADNGQIAAPTQIKDGFAIPMLVDKKEPRDADFAEVKDQVSNALKLEQAKAKIESISNELAANANSPDALKTAAEKYGLKAADAKAYKVGSPLGEGATSGSGEELADAIYNLKSGEVGKKAIKSGENYFVVAAAARTEANMDEFAKQREELIQSAVSQEKQQIFGDYISSLRQKMEKEGRIKIYKDALAKLETVKTPNIES